MEKIKKLKQLIIKEQLDGYIIPKNNEFFNEYVSPRGIDLSTFLIFQVHMVLR